MRICLSIPFDSYLYLLNLLEMHTAYKQAICVSVLQMCCNFGNKQRQANTHSTAAKVVQMSGISKQIRSFVLYSRVPPTLLKGSANERNIKTNTKFCFVFPSAAYFIKR